MNNRKPRHAQVHRFHDFVALFIRNKEGETLYLNPSDARKLAGVLTAAATSCETEAFGRKTVGTEEWDLIA